MGLRLTERDERILRHIARYRLTTLETVARLYFEPEGKTLEAAKSTLRRLWQDEEPLIESKPLTGKGREVYYHLGTAGARALGLPDPERMAHGFDKLEVRATHVGRLYFCCHGEAPRPKFTAEEFDQFFPGYRAPGSDLQARFFQDAYYLDTSDGVRRLGRILVDNGRDLVATAARLVEQVEAMFPEFLAADRFALALVFATEAKCDRARFTLRNQPLRDGLPLFVVLDHQPVLKDILATES